MALTKPLNKKFISIGIPVADHRIITGPVGGSILASNHILIVASLTIFLRVGALDADLRIH